MDETRWTSKSTSYPTGGFPGKDAVMIPDASPLPHSCVMNFFVYDGSKVLAYLYLTDTATTHICPIRALPTSLPYSYLWTVALAYSVRDHRITVTQLIHL